MNQEHAFPSVELDQVTGGVCVQHFGMSLRDYFAAKALPGLLDKWPSLGDCPESTKRAYGLADAMLKARKE